MLGLLQKVIKHGIKGSFKIIKQKTNVIFYNLKIRRGYYSFRKNKKYFNDGFQKMIFYLKSVENNTNLNLNISNNDEFLLHNNCFLMGKEFNFDEKINWHFYSYDINKSYELCYSNKLKVMNFEKYGDYRITWELNRHHQFVWFAQNFYLTSDSKYVKHFSSQINNWLISNKPGIGINYVSSMEIAIRLINWIVTFVIFARKTEVHKILTNEIVQNILGQTLFLNDNLFIKRKYKNNHSIVELAGLIIFQSIFQLENITDVQTLYKWLFEELEDQFYEDGINFEHSTTYSRFTIESLLILLIMIKDVGSREEVQKLNNLVNKYVSSLRSFVTPQDSVPFFSDSDNGRMLFLSGSNKDFTDFRGFFDFCGIYFDEDSFFLSKSISELNNETKWWCFLANKKLRVSKSTLENNYTTFFPKGGYFLNRTHDIFLAFKSNYPGNTNLNNEYAPHVHNDLLSFELFLNNQPFLVDSGTYTYNQVDKDYREYFRSAYAHNAIIIDGKPQFDYYEYFGAKNFPSVSIIKNGDFEVEGSIKYSNGNIIKRNISIKNDRIIFSDKINNLNINSLIEIVLNFSAIVEISNIEFDNKSISCIADSKLYRIEFSKENSIQPEIKKTTGWLSDFYNCKTQNQKIILTFPNVQNDLVFNWRIIFE